MTIDVRFFASIREAVGCAEHSFNAGSPCSAREIWARITDLPLPPNTLVAINQDYAGLDALVRDGDEVAFFPPVTGG